MQLDLSKLENVKHLSGGKTTARCPACAADGGDAKGEHLVIFQDGKFGCVTNAKDKEHNKLIVRLAGSKGRGEGGSGCRLTVNPLRVDESKVLMKVGRLGRVKPALGQTDVGSALPAAMSDPQGVETSCPEGPASEAVPVGGTVSPSPSDDLLDEESRVFLDTPVESV